MSPPVRHPAPASGTLTAAPPARRAGPHRRTSLPGLAASRSPVSIGVEHELTLWRQDGQADFRVLVAQVAARIPALDPGDPRSRRLPSGVALTADGREAELATPPVPLGPEAAGQVDDLLRFERTELLARVREHGVLRLAGFSTHLNISVSDDQVVSCGRQFVSSCVRGLAAITEPVGSAGIFVRPRRGRLEVGTEYVEGPRLVAALTLLAACRAGLLEGTRPPVDAVPTAEGSREKYGWFVPPDELDRGPQLEELWTWARPWCLEAGLDSEPVDRMVGLPRRASVEPCSFGAPPAEGPPAGTAPRTRPGGIHAETEWLTWQHVVWAFSCPDGRSCRAVVPATLEADFLRCLDAGDLDEQLARMLRRPLLRRRLLVSSQLTGPDWWHDVRPGALVPAERRLDGTIPRVSRRAARRDLARILRAGGRELVRDEER